MNRGDDITRELDAMSSHSDVESELAALKAGSGGSQQALEPGDSTPAAQVEPTQVGEPQTKDGHS